MTRKYSPVLVGLAAVALMFSVAACSSKEAEVITLRGANQFDKNHVFSRTLFKFEELVKEYYGKPVNFEFYLNSELGLEKEYFAYMSQGVSVDFAHVSPSHMSTFSKAAPLMDMPFLFRDLDHWNKVLSGDALKPITDDVEQKADVKLIGFSGGGTRNITASKRITTIAELEGLDIRVMGAPIQTRIFQAIHAAPTVIAYNEIYNAVQTGVIDAAENEATGIQQMKFYEVGPEISLTQHAITVRPLVFSGKTFRRLPEDLQAAILRAGREAGEFGRETEAREDHATLLQMEAEGKIRTHEFTERAALLRLAAPVKEAYANELGVREVLARIDAVK
ncbi:TRAP transporter substrate-binding protein [Synoicihabitans lomoniglobus]|uniref:TRAP transporter substrate-binding protein n=1 Tax=Synoicihabitans lomoniglobus TaxID=2909285 RepID=A0AAF0A197_9BACT|nr:TRAP transporter substrate-binding protein [Opitutaceae bacterium LMO-M01]WED65593.1 TRAP transporter substrate-binding protein [Opitutaceae bacterium LMO-M01]